MATLNRNTAQRCGTCAAYKKGGGGTGECRLTAPQLVAPATPEWPVVDKDDWCQGWVPQMGDPGWNQDP